MRPPDDWKTPSQPRLIGHLNDAHGHSVAISADRDEIVIRRGGQDIRLSADERDTFMRIFMEAERQAEAWQPPGDACTYEAVLPSGRLPCALPRGHEPPHLYGPAT